MTAIERVKDLVSTGRPAALAIWTAAREYGVPVADVARRYRGTARPQAQAQARASKQWWQD